MDENEIKKQIRQLKKLKLQCRAGTPERIKLHRQIKELKNKLVELDHIEPAKEKLIANILELEPNFPKDLVDLRKFSVEQLQKHIEKVTEKRKRGLI